MEIVYLRLGLIVLSNLKSQKYLFGRRAWLKRLEISFTLRSLLFFVRWAVLLCQERVLIEEFLVIFSTFKRS